MRRKGYLLAILVLVAASAAFLVIERLTGNEFMFHLAAIPLEILLAVFAVQYILDNRESEKKRKRVTAMSRYSKEILPTSFLSLKLWAMSS